MEFVAEIIKWYAKNKRDLPWRDTKDPYKIWISEIILQQTRVDQGLPYYLKFIERFPDVKSLAKAKEEEVLKYWQGLGYYSRARNIHFAAKQVINDYNSVFPKSYENIIKLKGIGEYTAAAIASFSFNECKPVLDGNVFRIIARYFGVEEAIDKPKGKKVFYEILNQLIVNSPPALFNQAIMEFGALQCKPTNPDCGNCPLIVGCYALKNNKINQLPFKELKTKVKEVCMYYIVISNKNELLFRKRDDKGIWKNMYDFILIESNKKLTSKQLSLELAKQLNSKESLDLIIPINPVTHILSHRKLQTYFINIELNKNKVELKNKDLKWYSPQSAKKLPLPKLIENYLNDIKYFD